MPSVYDRQQRIPDWNQLKLSDAKVAVIGDDVLANFTAAGLAGLGVGSIRIYGNARVDGNNSRGEFLLFGSSDGDPKTKIIAERIKGINSAINVEGIHWNFLQEGWTPIIRKPDVLIDTTNSTRTEYNLMKYGFENKIPVINASTNTYRGEINLLRPGQEIPQRYIHDEYDNLKQSFETSGVLAGTICDLVRKIVMPMPGDSPLPTDPIIYNRRSKTRISGESTLPEFKSDLEKKVLIIGAGSLGNFVGLNLSLKGVKDITIIDDDEVEEVNLNRQILFGLYHAVTGKSVIGVKKSIALREVLYAIAPGCNIEAIDGRFDKNFSPDYDILFDCVDSYRARREEHYWSIQHKKPIVSMGTDFKSGSVYAIVPGYTSCLDCRKNILKEAEREDNPQSCAAEPDPSVISSNMTIASIGANEYDFVSGSQSLKPINGKIGYDSQLNPVISTVPFDSICTHFNKGDN